ncbi:hypothetical protein [Streptomyces sp. cmx-18-6]|uniref:hypothetical protein n=1 Tax=Streptomyces sp. cmx-18-6 TaxID=2790930 RepID=UPI00397EDC96
MSQPPTEPDTYLTVCGHTHLFPGTRCRIQGLPDPVAYAAAPHPIDVYLRFSDSATTDAALHTTTAGPTLTVPTYTTGAGTTVDGRTWTVKELTDAGDEVELRIGTLIST